MSTPPSSVSLDRVAQFTSFATLGAVNVVQDLTHAIMRAIDGADGELVAEETLCLVATATARAAEVGLRAEPEHAATVAPCLLALPFTYRDYLIGSAMLAEDNRSLAEAGEAVRSRLERKQQFYTSHLPPGQFPGPRALKDKMELWMGRVSPPKLPESPQERLAKLNLTEPLLTHLKLVLAYGRQGGLGE